MFAAEVEDLTVSYDKTPVLLDIDVGFVENKISAICGPNGAGKSTLLKTLLGFIEPLAGRRRIFQKDIKDGKDDIAYVPQVNTVNWDFPISVFDVVLMGQYQNIGLFKRPGKKEKALAENALLEMGIETLSKRQISELSGGQKQRVFIARALCQDKKLLIMDEPLAGVDQKTEAIIMQKMQDLKKQGKTIIAVHHDLHTLEKYFDEVIILNRILIAQGPVKTTLTKENIAKAYGEIRS